MCIFSESNSKPSDDLEGSFPEYDIIMKNETNHPMARMTIMVKKNTIQYEHIHNIQDDNIASLWLKVKLGHKKYIMIGGYYRQWRLPMETQIFDSGSTKSQVERFSKFLNQVKRARQISPRLVVCGDINIDLSENRDQLDRPELKVLYPLYQDFRDEEDFTVMNKELTRFQIHQKPSLIDHVLTNSPELIDNIETKPGIISDHKIVTCLVHSEELVENPRYRFKTDWWKIEEENATAMVLENQKLMETLTRTSTEKIWTLMIEGMNEVINGIAPTKVVQCKADYIPYINKEVLEHIEETNEQLTKAIETKKTDEWRLYTNLRNQVGKLIEGSKKVFFELKQNTTKGRWYTIKNLAQENKTTTPSRILDKGAYITSPKEIANSLQDFFIDKIIKIREGFTPPTVAAREILRRISVPPKTRFILREITLEETKECIRSLKSSNTVGFDRVTSRFLKLTISIISVIIMHAINSSIRENKFPDAVKIARVLPILKSNSNKLDKSKYRPISNLHSAEKVFEEHIKRQLTEYLETNNIIHENHHGGRAGRSTMTAKAAVDNIISEGYEADKINVILSTDLSAAFDSVDHEILLDKMQFYGIIGKENKFFRSYLDSRTQYVELETKRSYVRTLPPCGVIQGSKLSGTLYSIYTNEIPLIKNIMKDEELLKEILQRNDVKPINKEHESILYVDDTYHCITSDNENELEEYLNLFADVMAQYFNANMLKMNEDKTTLMISCQPKHENKVKEIEIENEDENENVKQQDQIKVLGYLTNRRGRNDSQVMKLVAETSNIINKAQKTMKYLNMKTRKLLMNSQILSRINYCAPLIAGETEEVKYKVYKVIHRAARFILNDYCFKVSISNIMKKVQWKMPKDMIDEASAKFTHKIIFTNTPAPLSEKIRPPRSRTCADHVVRVRARSNRLERTAIHTGVRNYNRLPPGMKSLPPKKLRKSIKEAVLLPDKKDPNTK